MANGVWMPNVRDSFGKTGRAILNGWAFSTIVTMTTGHPVTPYISGYPSGEPDGGVTGGVAYAGRDQWPRGLAAAQCV